MIRTQRTSTFSSISQQALLASALALGLIAGSIRTPAMAADAPLFERIGGYKAVAAAVDHLVDNIYVNKTLNMNPSLKAVHDLDERAAFKLVLATWVMENTGGPKVYFGRPMDKAHSHLNISNREFDVILHECKETFFQLGVAEKEMGELMAGLEAQREKVVTAEAPKK